jgi:hypothetical protein
VPVDSALTVGKAERSHGARELLKRTTLPGKLQHVMLHTGLRGASQPDSQTLTESNLI